MDRVLEIFVSRSDGESVELSSEGPPDVPFGVVRLVVAETKDVAGPELVAPGADRFVLAVPEGWRELPEKELAALRRTITGAAIEVGRKTAPRAVYAAGVDLCGLAGVVVSRMLACPLVLELSEGDVETGFFDERKVSIFDSCLKAARAAVVPDDRAAEFLKACYPSLGYNVLTRGAAGAALSSLAAGLRPVLPPRRGVPWERPAMKRVPVSRPSAAGPELGYLEEVLESGWWGYGPAARHLEGMFEALCGAGFHSLAVTSCTAALHMALLAAGVGPGDEVILPALTFTATAAAVIHAGATPRFADVSPSTLALSPESVARELSPKTKAVVPVHYAGVPFDVSSLEGVIGDRPVSVIEDAAHAMGAEVNGRPVGAQSRFTCFSFAPTKHVPSCTGGVLVYADGSLTNELRELSDLGLRVDTHQRSVASGVGPANVVGRVGYRYRMNDISAAIAVAQLQHLPEILERRSALVGRYRDNLSSVGPCELLEVPERVRPSWYIMPLRVPAAVRDSLRAHLARAGIDTSVHYPSLLEQPAFRGMPGNAPVASREALRLISLPLYSTMTEGDVDQVCSAISDFLSG